MTDIEGAYPATGREPTLLLAGPAHGSIAPERALAPAAARYPGSLRGWATPADTEREPGDQALPDIILL